MIEESLQVQSIALSLIDRPDVPDRMSISPEYIKELADSIGQVGLMQPIILSPRNGRFEIVAGDCRYQAFLSLGRTEIPAIIKELDAESVSISRATENLQRADLTVIEEARIYQRLHIDHKMTWDMIAKRTGKSASIIKRRYDLLKMPEILIKALHDKKIGYAVAEELDRLKDLAKVEYYMSFCIDHGATLTVVRGWVDEAQAQTRQKSAVDGGGDWVEGTPEARVVYTSCDCCHGPVDVMRVQGMRVCPECKKTILQNMQ
jgi:ParB family chromosome partitioning protein